MTSSYRHKSGYPMRMKTNLKLWMISVLMIAGTLISCSPLQTPVAIPTSTIIPSTATATGIPLTPTNLPPSTTPVNLSTDSPSTIPTILETSLDLDVEFTRNIMTSLAEYLSVPANRVQIVSVETANWDVNTLGCPEMSNPFRDVILREVLDVDLVTGLRYVLLVGNTLYEYHSESTERYIRCQGQELVSGEVLVIVDPLAAETLRVVQNLLATELDLSTRRVQLIDMIPVTWEDTSLGCPQPDRTYTEAEIQGYHIVVTAGNETYIYHSDSNTAYPCPVEQSIIPAN